MTHPQAPPGSPGNPFDGRALPFGKPIAEKERTEKMHDPKVLPRLVEGELLPWKGWWWKVVGVTRYQELVLKAHQPMREKRSARTGG